MEGLHSDIEIRASGPERGTYVLSTQQWLPAPLANVFEYFSDPGNLEAITPPWLQFCIITPGPFEMRAGVLIDYRLRLHLWPIRWRTEIAVWEPPHRFVDRQIRGPYRKWVHTHTFVARDGGTLMDDRVEYRVPLRWITHDFLVKRDLLKIFAYRRRVLMQQFPG